MEKLCHNVYKNIRSLNLMVVAVGSDKTPPCCSHVCSNAFMNIGKSSVTASPVHIVNSTFASFIQNERPLRSYIPKSAQNKSSFLSNS